MLHAWRLCLTHGDCRCMCSSDARLPCRTAKAYYAKALDLTAGGSLRALYGLAACAASLPEKVCTFDDFINDINRFLQACNALISTMAVMQSSAETHTCMLICRHDCMCTLMHVCVCACVHARVTECMCTWSCVCAGGCAGCPQPCSH